MRKTFYTLLLLSFFSFFSFGQEQGGIIFVDTMKAAHRLVAFDSTDRMFPSTATTIPGSAWSTETGLLTPNWLFANAGMQRFTKQDHLRNYPVFAAVPFLGVGYSFGNNGFQGVQVDYQQNLSRNKYISFDYRQLKSDGFLRNNQTIDQLATISFTRLSRTYSNELHLTLASSDSYASGGVVNDSSLNLYPIEFVATPKSDARTVVKRFVLDQHNYFNFLKDSIRGLGMFLDNQLTIRKFEFTETGLLAAQYPLIQWDSASTFDRYQSNRFTSCSGIYASNRKYNFKLGAFGTYWQYYNRGIFRDTVEAGIQQNVTFQDGGLRVTQSARYAILGAQNGLRFQVSGRYRSGKYFAEFIGVYSDELPSLNQRFQWGNNYSSLAASWNKEKRSNAELSIGHDWSASATTKLVGNIASLQDAYFFSQGAWSSTLASSITSFSFGLEQLICWRIMRIEGMYRTTTLDGLAVVIPANYAKLRLAIKGKPGKRDKLLGMIGVEGEWYTSFQRVTYLPMVGAFDPFTASGMLPGRTNAAVFATAEIGLFRIYARMENLGYFWTDKRWMEVDGYPIATGQFKLGITWDFFN